MSNNENMIHNFQNMISNLENETKLLKFSFFLRQNTSTSHDMNKELSKLHANIDNFQNDLTEFEDFLDSELNLLNQLNELTHLTQQQHQNIQRISSSLPSFFHDKKKNITFLDDPKNGVSKSAAASSAVGGNEEEIKDLLIELNEFENIPKSTRSRLTLEQIIIALNNIQRLIIQKGEVSEKLLPFLPL